MNLLLTMISMLISKLLEKKIFFVTCKTIGKKLLFSEKSFQILFHFFVCAVTNVAKAVISFCWESSFRKTRQRKFATERLRDWIVAFFRSLDEVWNSEIVIKFLTLNLLSIVEVNPNGTFKKLYYYWLQNINFKIQIVCIKIL